MTALSLLVYRMGDNKTAILVMGVCGVGKTTVARALAENLGAVYVEADDFHPAENVRLMKSGTPLNDENRAGWLSQIARHVVDVQDQNPRVVVACSALKKRYRDQLRKDVGAIQIVHLVGDKQLLEQRMSKRAGHFMPTTLLDSQFGDLEPPEPQEENAVRVNVDAPIETITLEAEAFCRAGSLDKTIENQLRRKL
jgi:gluconokinase